MIRVGEGFPLPQSTMHENGRRNTSPTRKCANMAYGEMISHKGANKTRLVNRAI